MYNIKYDLSLYVEKYNKTGMDIQKTSKTEQPLTKQMQLEQSPEKTCQKKKTCGEKY